MKITEQTRISSMYRHLTPKHFSQMEIYEIERRHIGNAFTVGFCCLAVGLCIGALLMKGVLK